MKLITDFGTFLVEKQHHNEMTMTALFFASIYYLLILVD